MISAVRACEKMRYAVEPAYIHAVVWVKYRDLLTFKRMLEREYVEFFSRWSCAEVRSDLELYWHAWMVQVEGELSDVTTAIQRMELK